MPIIQNRYDKLKARQKELRNKIEARNTLIEGQVKKLQVKISQLRYQRDVYCKDLNNKLVDVTSLLQNEQNRIIEDSNDTKR